jgi:hypothetical protein
VQSTNSAHVFCRMLLHAPAARQEVMTCVLDDARQWLEVWEDLLSTIEILHSAVAEKLRMKGYTESSIIQNGHTMHDCLRPFREAERLLRLHLSNMLLEIWNVRNRRPDDLFREFGRKASTSEREPPLLPPPIPNRRKGRPEEYDWPSFTTEAVRFCMSSSISRQGELETHMAEWCQENWGEENEPAPSTIRERVAPIFKGAMLSYR